MITEATKTDHDSFDDVDRILIIVEGSKAKWEKVKVRFTFYMLMLGPVALLALYTLCFMTIRIGFDSFKGESFVISIFSLTLSMISIFYFYEQYREANKDYNQTALRATDLIREIMPALAKSENWSMLRRFELELRLTKLGISKAERSRKQQHNVFDELYESSKNRA
jgi:uncharacterized membrane protein